MALRKLLLIISMFVIGDCFGQSPMFKLVAKRQSSPPAGISFVSQVSASNASAATTSGINTTGVNLIVIAVASYSILPTISDSYSNTWTQLTSTISSNSVRVRLYYCLNPTVGSGHTFSFLSSNTYTAINVLTFSGATGYDTESTANGNSPLGPSVTPANNNSLIISVMGNLNASSVTVSGSFTKYDVPYVYGVNVSCYAAYYIQPTAASISCTWTFTSPGATSVAVFY